MRRKWLLPVSVVLAALVLLGAVIVACVLFTPAYRGEEDVPVYVYPGDDSVKEKLSEAGVRTTGFRMLASLGFSARPGMYLIHGGDNIFSVFMRLRSGRQDPLNLALPSLRTMDDLAVFLGSHLMMDSLEVASSFADSSFTARFGYSPQTLPALFIPNTYQVYWNISLDAFLERMRQENAAFWTPQREAKAREATLTHVQVATLASIVDEETANNAEKPMIAGLYINRLRQEMPLQADPTVKFALGDFALRRLLKAHLETDNPYNTYVYEGLPPGPIRIPSIAGIDAVLNYVHHPYIYMCAKEDFSGTHNFAATYPEHLRNARLYQKALNARGIK